MEQYVRTAKLFQQDPGKDEARTYHELIAFDGDGDRLGVELVLQNVDAESRLLEVSFRCYKLAETPQPPCWTFRETISFHEEESEVIVRRLTPNQPETGDYECEIHLDGDYAARLFFQIVGEATERTSLFEASGGQTYEAAAPDYYDTGLTYTSLFDTTQTRYVCLECRIADKTGKPSSDLVEFRFRNQAGSVIGIDRRTVTLTAESPVDLVRGGWGLPQKGHWQPGKYHIDVVHRDHVLLSRSFECYFQHQSEAESYGSSGLDHRYLSIDPQQLKPFPEEIDIQLAVILAYKEELDKIADYLKNGLSVLIECDKILVEYLYEYLYTKAEKTPLTDQSYDLDKLYVQLGMMRNDRIMILRSVEMLNHPDPIFMLYHTVRGHNAQFLAFRDSSTNLSPALIHRFALHISLGILPKRIFQDAVVDEKNGQPGFDLFQYVVTKRERACFLQDPTATDQDREFGAALYKHVANLNIIQFRQAMQYVGALFKQPVEPKKIFQEIRRFKTSLLGDDIEIPDITFEHIGGYSHVKAELTRMLGFLTERKEQKRRAPKFKGFILHGPPGTGKTLFAKAIANELNATIQMISGPEIIDKWVGQSEANLRRIFNVARRNAPSIILFDEFDSIARKRTGSDDGGARAGNSLMAQLLTELDGFREDDGVLVIGTTNQLNLIDEALQRPSRLTPIKIDLPDTEGRKRVAEKHAEYFGVDQVLKQTFAAVQAHIAAWDGASIPEGFLHDLYRINPKVEKRMHLADEMARMQSDLREYFAFAQSLQVHYQQNAPTTIPLLTEKLKTLAEKYHLDLEALPDEIENRPQLTIPQRDILDLFATLGNIRTSGGQLTADAYFGSVIDLIAEFTEGFNNDEIRAVFQEISIDYEANGQILTPRFLGKKIGMIQKRKSSKTK